MLNIKSALRHASLAMALALGALTASATPLPVYRVVVDTTGLSATGYLDLTFTGTGGTHALVTMTSLQGEFGNADPYGDVDSPEPGVYTIGTGAAHNLLSHVVNFGGLFSFDLVFSGDFLTAPNPALATSMLTIGLINEEMVPVGNADGNVIFALAHLSDLGPATVAFSNDGFANVSMVPEPSSMIMALSGLMLMGCLLVRRRA